MISTREIRRRIRSISSTAQITKAMQMVAASKMRKAQQATTQSIEFKNPLLEVREVRRRAVVLVSTDKGLCGALNSNLFRLATQFDPASTTFITIGRKAAQFIARSGRQLTAEFAIPDTPRFPDARAIAGLARDLFLNKEVDEVKIAGTRFINTLTQQAGTIEYLPIGAITTIKIDGMPTEEELTARPKEFLFEPNPESVLAYLLNGYLNIVMHQVLLNAKASEQSARMVSMKNASDNAEGLIKDLTLEYNKLRQGNITKELLDIAGGQASSD